MYQLLDRFTPTAFGIQNNRWLFYHCLVGALAGKLFARLGASLALAVGIACLLAVAYETLQFLWQANRGGILKHNASWTHWWWDSFFDVVGATTFAALAV